MPKLTASFLDFLLEEELGVDFWCGVLWVWEAASTWDENTGCVIWEDFKGADEHSCGVPVVTSEDPGWLVWRGVPRELRASLFSKFFLFATLFLVTCRGMNWLCTPAAIPPATGTVPEYEVWWKGFPGTGTDGPHGIEPKRWDDGGIILAVGWGKTGGMVPGGIVGG